MGQARQIDMTKVAINSTPNHILTVALHIADGVAILTIDGPLPLVATAGKMAADLEPALEELVHTRGIRVALLRISRRAFCAAGPNVDTSQTHDAAQRVNAGSGTLDSLLVKLQSSPVVVVAAVQDFVDGSVLRLMNAADLVVAASDTCFYTVCGSNGLPTDAWRPPRMSSERQASHCPPLPDGFDAVRAQMLGLVNYVVPPECLDAEVDSLLHRLLAPPRSASAMCGKPTHRLPVRTTHPKATLNDSSASRSSPATILAHTWVNALNC